MFDLYQKKKKEKDFIIKLKKENQIRGQLEAFPGKSINQKKKKI